MSVYVGCAAAHDRLLFLFSVYSVATALVILLTALRNVALVLGVVGDAGQRRGWARRRGLRRSGDCAGAALAMPLRVALFLIHSCRDLNMR